MRAADPPARRRWRSVARPDRPRCCSPFSSVLALAVRCCVADQAGCRVNQGRARSVVEDSCDRPIWTDTVRPEGGRGCRRQARRAASYRSAPCAAAARLSAQLRSEPSSSPFCASARGSWAWVMSATTPRVTGARSGTARSTGPAWRQVHFWPRRRRRVGSPTEERPSGWAVTPKICTGGCQGVR